MADVTRERPGPIPLTALVARASQSPADLTRDLRDIARQAAADWSQENAKVFLCKDPQDFAVSVAQVYLGVLRELNAGFKEFQP